MKAAIFCLVLLVVSSEESFGIAIQKFSLKDVESTELGKNQAKETITNPLWNYFQEGLVQFYENLRGKLTTSGQKNRIQETQQDAELPLYKEFQMINMVPQLTEVDGKILRVFTKSEEPTKLTPFGGK